MHWLYKTTGWGKCTSVRRLRVHVKHVLSELSMCYSSTDPDPKWSNIIFLTLLNQKKLLADQICESSFIYMYSTLLNILFQSQLFNYHSLGHLIWLTSPYATSCDLKSHPHLLLAGVWNQLCSALGFGCLNGPNGACLIELEQLRGNHMHQIYPKAQQSQSFQRGPVIKTNWGVSKASSAIHVKQQSSKLTFNVAWDSLGQFLEGETYSNWTNIYIQPDSSIFVVCFSRRERLNCVCLLKVNTEGCTSI